MVITDHPIAMLAAAAVISFFAIQLYVGVFIPLQNRHESLLNKYSETYVSETFRVFERHGVGKVINTNWFDVYAAEFCERLSQSSKS